MAPRARYGRSAFTLVELVIVILVLVVAAGVVAPALGGNETTKLREAARLIAADLAYAQIDSIAHADDPRVVRFDLAANRYWIASRSTPNTPLVKGGEPYRVTLGRGRASALHGVRLVAVSVNGDPAKTTDALGFGIYGELDQATPATIELGCGEARLTLTVDPTTGEAAIGQVE